MTVPVAPDVTVTVKVTESPYVAGLALEAKAETVLLCWSAQAQWGKQSRMKRNDKQTPHIRGGLMRQELRKYY